MELHHSTKSELTNLFLDKDLPKKGKYRTFGLPVIAKEKRVPDFYWLSNRSFNNEIVSSRRLVLIQSF
jgi:hypothetical protein